MNYELAPAGVVNSVWRSLGHQANASFGKINGLDCALARVGREAVDFYLAVFYAGVGGMSLLRKMYI